MKLFCSHKSLVIAVTLAILGSSACERSPETPAQAKEKKHGLFERPDPVADGIRETLARAPKNEINALVKEFYELRNYKPAWKRRGRLEQLTAALRELKLDGLDPADYSLAQLEQASGEAPEPETEAGAESAELSKAERDLLASKAYLSALLHLRNGKLDRAQRPRGLVQTGAKRAPKESAPFDVHWAVAAQDNGRIKHAFDEARPQHPVYEALRVALAKLLEQQAQGGWPSLPAATLKPGSSSADVALLRERLAAAGYLGAETAEDKQQYDDELTEAVRQFQREQFLKDDGVVNAETRAALNVPVEKRIDQIRVNLERARWQLRDLGDDFVLVDVTGYEVRYYRDAEPVLVSRAQVGEPETPTPMLRSEITHITLNPQWTVPPGMMEREFLPALEDGEEWLLASKGLKVVDEAGNEIDPEEVDWDEPYGVYLRQDAGPRSSLGRAAIRFPNPHFVYLHETPKKKLFDSTQRAFSNGCIRVEQAMELVQHLLGWDQVDIDAAIADGKTHEVPLPEPVPILVAYWTIDLHENGRIAYKPDVYGLDAPTLRALDAA